MSKQPAVEKAQEATELAEALAAVLDKHDLGIAATTLAELVAIWLAGIDKRERINAFELWSDLVWDIVSDIDALPREVK